ncbi:DNA primase [Aeromicrobium sp. 50.2.37]|uniref:DNA primase n=1 Tax=Aeromicrobium sp. 50.2.37 TaxID=2969305 RepID=UPI00214FF6DC|nr:DNA primase [Aeromicrobium sp. 50.2.37]MCR4512085.1 DNA primase [Aeromicrobium sp. 50.2.37]
MAGLINDEDIQLVRERARIDEVVEQYVTLRRSGGTMKGLCPFHDEKTPSFHANPARGTFHCFGCGEGGDAIAFIQKIEGLSFVESMERLAAKYGIQLRYEEGESRGPRRDPQQRQRLLEAHRLAGEFYAQTLASAAEASPGRRFVTDRGFDQRAAETFAMGWAPRSGTALIAHLKGKGFTDDELVTGGLARRSSRGLFDAFQGRLLWPIREMTSEIIGFGARRMFEDDFMQGKYVNTSESPIYKKSQVLYGVDLARRQISSESRAVVVEGYTDVMACHEAGVRTAVATCGTAFGEGHAKVLRRILLDDGAMHGEVVFTFDGDEAGQRAAMKAFEGDQQFAAQTYVAVEPRGMDPCDLRLADGDAGVRALVDARIPLYRFVLDNVLTRYDLDRADQRVDAVREAVGLASSIRDKSKVEEFLREVATRVGVDVDQVRTEHRRYKPAVKPERRVPTQQAEAPAPAPPPQPFVSFGARQFADEREALKALAQHPHLARVPAQSLDDDDFTHPVAQEIWRTMVKVGLPEQSDPTFVPRVSDALVSDDLRRVLSLAAMEPLSSTEGSTARVVTAVMARLRLLTVGRLVEDLRSKLQRTDPAEQPDEYREVFSQLLARQGEFRELRDKTFGGE